MAYVYAFDPTDPADNGLVSLGASDFRELKNAIKERVESFFSGIDVQPWVAKTGATFAGTASFAGLVTMTAGLAVSAGPVTLTPATFAVGSAAAVDANSLTLQSANGNYLIRFKNAAGTSLGGIYSPTGTTLLFDSATGISVANSLTVGSTGTFTGAINVNTGNGTFSFNASSATTGFSYANISNTTGFLRWGVEGNTPGSLAAGTTAYASVVGAVLNATDLQLITNNTVRLTLDGTSGAATFTSTATATRLIGGTTVASSIAKGVTSDGSAGATPAISTAQVLSHLSTFTSTDASGTTRVGNLFSLIQSVATAASIPALQGVGQSTHTSGTLNGMYGGHFIAEAAGVGGTTTTLLGLKAQAGIRGLATVVDAISLEVSQYTASSGVSTNAYGIKISTGITNGTAQNWAIYCTSSATSGGVTFRDTAIATNATVGHFFIPSSAGAPTGVPGVIPTGQIAMQYDSTNNFLYVYNGGWKKSIVYA